MVGSRVLVNQVSFIPAVGSQQSKHENGDWILRLPSLDGLRAQTPWISTKDSWEPITVTEFRLDCLKTKQRISF